jgi:hypothetical protein
MTIRNTTLLTAAVAGAFALGIVSGPTIRDQWSKTKAPEANVMNAPEHPAATPTPAAESRTPARVKTEQPMHRAKSEPVGAKKPANAVQTIAVTLWEPELRDRVKAVLNPGTRLELAAADFEDSEEFVTVAHAAHNTNVPFVVLKDRVLNRGQSLASAIHEVKPELDARAEVTRARSEARSTLGISG